mgnify:CR=1 FL=1
MEPFFDYERLEVYKVALEFLDAIFNVCEKLPRSLQSSLGDQLRRASLSISNNIAEGSGKKSGKEKARYYSISQDSARECISMLNVLILRKIATTEEFNSLRTQGKRITGMIAGLINAINL